MDLVLILELVGLHVDLLLVCFLVLHDVHFFAVVGVDQCAHHLVDRVLVEIVWGPCNGSDVHVHSGRGVDHSAVDGIGSGSTHTRIERRANVQEERPNTGGVLVFLGNVHNKRLVVVSGDLVQRVHRNNHVDVLVPRQGQSVSDPSQHGAVCHKGTVAGLVAKPQPGPADTVDNGLVRLDRVVETVEESPVKVCTKQSVHHVSFTEGVFVNVGVLANNLLDFLLHGVHDLLMVIIEVLLGHGHLGHHVDLVAKLQQIRLVVHELVLGVARLNGGVIVVQVLDLVDHVVEPYSVLDDFFLGGGAPPGLIFQKVFAHGINIFGTVENYRLVGDWVPLRVDDDGRLVESCAQKMDSCRRRSRGLQKRCSVQNTARLFQLEPGTVVDLEPERIRGKSLFLNVGQVDTGLLDEFFVVGEKHSKLVASHFCEVILFVVLVFALPMVDELMVELELGVEVHPFRPRKR
ncbi:hypothetical protein OGAPHI_007330 [Ogataea philodendri]|uniref:Uncharacterized protein n=1 Tax=Ogataea philodendri TaxID=1378263 RepID=A0A9P8SZR0_9ASCO|nr:uncharacterized protein OGAPHI_007330 [Ogataea philodendri]KAH3660125.1 hypothetical protein OGAPHI_007330 [Ogataea philodendri]